MARDRGKVIREISNNNLRTINLCVTIDERVEQPLSYLFVPHIIKDRDLQQIHRSYMHNLVE